MFNAPQYLKYKREIALEQKLRFFEHYPKDSQSLSKRMPIVQTTVKNTVSKLYRASDTDIVEVDGYLEFKIKDDKIFSRTVVNWLKDKDLDTTKGYRLYEFYAELSKLPTGVLIIAPIDFQINGELPYRIKVVRLGRLNSLEEIFYLKDDPEPSVLQPPAFDISFPVLTQKQILRCFAQISSLSMNDKHVCDSIISPYVSCDVERTNINGMGNSFLSDTQQVSEDLNNLHEVLNNTKFGVPLAHYGILNILSGNVIDIKGMRTSPNFQRFRAISCNLESTQHNNNLLLSDFKYASEGINFNSVSDIKNNVALQQSLAYYSLIKNKVVPYELQGSAILKAIKVISLWTEKVDKKVIGNIIDENNLDTQVARIASYTLGVTKKPNEDIIVRKVENTVKNNIGSIVEKIHTEALVSEKKIRHEIDIPLPVRLAFYSSDRTKQGFSEKIMELLGYNNKRAVSYVEQLEGTGTIFLSDGVHYNWFSESKLKFK